MMRTYVDFEIKIVPANRVNCHFGERLRCGFSATVTDHTPIAGQREN
jgi:hypothetical protein